MDIKLLGPTELAVDGAPSSLGGPRQRAVLVDLALHAGHVVTMSELVEDLWGSSPPSSAGHTVESYVSRLRRVLRVEGVPSVLVSGGSGYRLSVSPEQVDALRFGELVVWGTAALHRADTPAAAASLSAALALWCGPALADVQDSAFAPITARPAGERPTGRLRVLDRGTAHPAAAPRGRFRARARRRPRPLPRAVPRPAHARPLPLRTPGGRVGSVPKSSCPIDRDLGLEPGRELRELERAILLQAPELDPPRPSAPLAPWRGGTATNRTRRRCTGT